MTTKTNATFEAINEALKCIDRDPFNGDASGAFHYFVGFVFQTLEDDKVIDQYERAALEVSFALARQRFYIHDEA